MLALPSQRRLPHVSHVLFALNVTSLLFGGQRTEPPLKPPQPLGVELEVLWGQHLPTAPLGFPDLE